MTAGTTNTSERGGFRTASDNERSNGGIARTAPCRRGFTLVEMMVVVAIVIVVLGLVVPAASSMWAERKNAESINLVQGLLATSRARALKADGVETGFFAFLDAEGVQRVVTIAQSRDCLDEPVMENVFVITDEPDRIMPVPMRLVPRYIVDVKSSAAGGTDKEGYEFFSDDELANETFDAPPPDSNQAQRHRNFFTMIFSRDGSLRVNRDVLIRDVDRDDPPDGFGDRTGLRVGPGDVGIMENPKAPFSERCRADKNPRATTGKYYLRDDTDDATMKIDQAIGFLIVDDKNVALNFPSVDGVMVYDQSVFADGGTPDEKRKLLLRTAQPLYINRFTGTVVRGPVGENDTP